MCVRVQARIGDKEKTGKYVMYDILPLRFVAVVVVVSGVVMCVDNLCVLVTIRVLFCHKMKGT